MTVFYTYCGLCWLLMLHRLWDAFRRLRLVGWLADKRAWLSLAASLQGFILAPLMLPIYLVIDLMDFTLNWRGRRLNRWLRSYREYLFEPVEPGGLPAEVATFFDEHTGPLERLQFRFVGDYWLWREPVPYLEREFLSADGRAFAAISSLGEEIRHVSFYSVLNDESYWETSLALYDNTETSRSPERSSLLQMKLYETKTIAELFRRHQERLDDAAHEAFSYQPEDVRAVSIYGSRLLGLQLYAEGLRDQLPPAAKPPRPQTH